MSEIDKLLSMEGNLQISPDQKKRLLQRLLLENVTRQIAKNKNYSDYCKTNGFSKENVLENIDSIPLIPAVVFKNNYNQVQTIKNKDILITTSSGTKGSISQVPRDNQTLMRFYSTINSGLQDVFNYKQTNFELLCLTPPSYEAKHLWISYLITGIDLFYPCTHYISNGSLEYDKLMNDLQRIEKNNDQKKYLIVGSPALIMDLTKLIRNNHQELTLDDRCLIVTMGGWKRRQFEMVSKDELYSQVIEVFGLRNDEYIRDAYNMVELNTVFFECKHHNKHCPPWIHVRARNPRTLNVLPSGDFGLLSFMDATPESFPGFLLSEDFGYVVENYHCPCGLKGDILQIERRVNKVESRGCALKI
jgi:long-chain-fatty-acid---luciferin-component ligase